MSGATRHRRRSRERGAPGQRRVPRHKREPEMLGCAQQVFARSGYEAAAMEGIADCAGVSKPMLYAYFGSKDDLYLAALGDAGEQLRATVACAISPEDPPEQRLWNGILALLDAVEAHPEWWLLSREAEARGGEAAKIVRRVHQGMTGLIGGQLAQAAVGSGAAGDALQALDMLGTAFVGTCEATCRWWIEHPNVPKGTVALQLMNLVWMGFGELLEGDLWIPEEAREI